MSAFTEGARLGQSLVQQGVDEYWRQRDFQEKMARTREENTRRQEETGYRRAEESRRAAAEKRQEAEEQRAAAKFAETQTPEAQELATKERRTRVSEYEALAAQHRAQAEYWREMGAGREKPKELSLMDAHRVKDALDKKYQRGPITDESDHNLYEQANRAILGPGYRVRPFAPPKPQKGLFERATDFFLGPEEPTLSGEPPGGMARTSADYLRKAR